jgi:hypothetical protein
MAPLREEKREANKSPMYRRWLPPKKFQEFAPLPI